MNTSRDSTPFRVALAGNPNCGKTTIFNALTGLRHKVANYPGVTVERKEGSFDHPTLGPITLVDLPGTYSLSAHSPDETIAAQALFGEIKNEPIPDLIISVVDASNLERNLYLTTQLIDLKIPIVLALNMTDIAERRGIDIKKEILGRELDLPVIALAAHKKEGINSLSTLLGDILTSKKRSSKEFFWCEKTHPYLLTAERISKDLVGSPLLKGCALLSEATYQKDPALTTFIERERETLRASSIEPHSFEATARYGWINTIVKRAVVVRDPLSKSRSDRIDQIVTHPLWGTLIFLFTMAVIFQSIFLWASIPMELIDQGITELSILVGKLLPSGILKSLIVEGIIPGVGSVLVFIPQIAILFLFLGALEDSGYLSRAAFLMDRIMRKVGLQGRSFIPLLSSFACAIPGIMSTRSIPSFADRMITILIAPLMSCSARLPVYTLLIAACVPDHAVFGFFSLQGLVLLAMYLLGIAGAAGVAKILKLTKFRGEPALFVMEMPPFRVPAFISIVREIVDRIALFLKSAGTVILACSVVLWFLASFPRGVNIEQTYAGRIGKIMEPAIAPLGFNWEVGVGILASFAAREVFVSSLATVYNIENKDDSASQSLLVTLKQKETEGTFSSLSAISLMVFYVFACMCMSTLAVCKRETGSWRWPAFMFVYMTALAYIASLITYQVGKLL